MFCPNCGCENENGSKFCANCGETMNVPEEGKQSTGAGKLSRIDWIKLPENKAVQKEFKFVKLLTYVTLGVLFACMLIDIICYMILENAMEKAAQEMGMVGFSSSIILAEVLLVIYFIPSAIFALLGNKTGRTGFYITYLIFGALAFGRYAALFFGGAPIWYVPIMAVPLAFIVIKQAKIIKKYKAFKG